MARNAWREAKIRREGREKKLVQQMQERASEAREAARRESAERSNAVSALRAAYGDEYHASARFLGKAARRMSPEQLEALDSERTPEGRRRGNDPATLQEIIGQERTPPAWFKDMAQKHGGERRAFDALVRDKSSGYWKGPDSDRLQAHFRDVVRQEQESEGTT